MSWKLPADEDRCYAAIESRDDRFDGWFIVGVRTTRIYCRPSCPTPVRPKRVNVAYFATPAAAQRAGFRACKRCRPDATPGSPEWNVRSDLVGRAMRLIGDGVVDREGVAGLAARLGVSSRHLHRLLRAEIGVGPLSIARAHRANTARTLIETTGMPFAEVAFAAGFASIRQFNDTVREVFATTPSELRGASRSDPDGSSGSLRIRLPFRRPFDAEQLFGWHRYHAVAGLSWNEGGDSDLALRRTLRLPNGHGAVRLEPRADHVDCELWLDDVADLATAAARCRQLLDLDADPVSTFDTLRADKQLRRLLDARPGLRVPGTVDGFEAAVIAVLGQQVRVDHARTLAIRLVQRFGSRVEVAGAERWLFPTPQTLAESDLAAVGMPTRRAAAIRAVAVAAIEGLPIHPGADRAELRDRLLGLPGVGPWTADIITMRAVADPDVLPAGDRVLRRAASDAGIAQDEERLRARSAAWSPWRSYVAHHLWAAAAGSGDRTRRHTPATTSTRGSTR